MNKISHDAALARLQKICSMQEKCIKDVMLKLKAWEISEQDCNKIIGSLQNLTLGTTLATSALTLTNNSNGRALFGTLADNGIDQICHIFK